MMGLGELLGGSELHSSSRLPATAHGIGPETSPPSPESFRIQYLQFLAYTKTPQYKAGLQQLLDQEKVRGARFRVPAYSMSHSQSPRARPRVWGQLLPEPVGLR